MQTSYSTMRLAHFGTLLLLLLPACADYGPPVEFADGGPSPDSGPHPHTGLERAGIAPGVCYDGEDNDLDGVLDCTEADCGEDVVCCVGSADCCTEGTPVSLTVPAGCEDGGVADCVGLDPAISAFGSILPRFESGGLVPQGGMSWGGVSLGAAVDPRSFNVTVQAQINVPARRCVDCIDAAGVGFFDALPAAGDRASVPLGVLVNGGRQEIQIIVGDVPVQTEPLAEGTSTVTVTLTVRVDGTVSVTRGGASIAELANIRLPDALQPVVFGRTPNRSGEPAVNVLGALARADACDVPSALTRRGAEVLPASVVGWAPTALGRPTVITLGVDGPARVAFADDRSILIAGPTATGELVGSSGPPDLLLAPPPGYEALHDPWLITEIDRIVLYVAGEEPDGTRTLLRVSGSAGFGLTLGEPAVVGLPQLGEDLIDGVTVFVDEVGEHRMIARVWRGGQSSLVAFHSFDSGLSFEFERSTLEASRVHAPTPDDVFAIDRDEVASPALLRVGGTWRLFYGARRGGRWSIGMLVSEDGAAWRPMGAVLSGSGTGYDALGVMLPAPFLTPAGVGLYFVASDGATSVIGLAGPPGTLGE